MPSGERQNPVGQGFRSVEHPVLNSRDIGVSPGLRDRVAWARMGGTGSFSNWWVLNEFYYRSWCKMLSKKIVKQ